MPHIILFDLSLNEDHQTGNTFGDVMALSLRLNIQVNIKGIDKKGQFLSLTSSDRVGFVIPNVTKEKIEQVLYENESAKLIEIGEDAKNSKVLADIIHKMPVNRKLLTDKMKQCEIKGKNSLLELQTLVCH